MEFHHHHDDSDLVKDGLIYYNESDLITVCDRAIAHFEKVQQEGIKQGKVYEDIGTGGKIDLLREMKAFFEHKA
jgi:hypothetical protein